MDLWYSRNESPSTRWCVRVTRPLFSGEGKSGRVDVLETEDFGRALSVGGCLALTEGEGFAQREMLVHAPLNVHPNARAALVVGGRDCGTVAELLRYPQLERIVLVEDDAVVLEAQRRFFPDLAASLTDPRVRVAQEDAESFARESKDRFDVAIIRSPGGSGEAAFSQSFYCDCFRLLSGDGILVAPGGQRLLPGQAARARERGGQAQAALPLVQALQRRVARRRGRLAAPRLRLQEIRSRAGLRRRALGRSAAYPRATTTPTCTGRPSPCPATWPRPSKAADAD